MSADHDDVLVDDLKRLGARMLAEATPITTEEIVDRTRPILGEPLLNGHAVRVRLDDRGDVVSLAEPSRGRRGGVLIGAVAATSVLTAGLVVANQRDAQQPGIGAVADLVSSTEPAVIGPAPTDVASTVQINHSLDDLQWPPRVLLDDSWEIVTANQPSLNEGYVTFRRDGTTVFVGWYSGDHIGNDKVLEGATEAGTATLLDETVTVYESALAYSAADIRDLVADGAIESPIVRDEFGPDSSSPPDVGTGLADDSLVGGPILDAELSDELAGGLIEGVPSSGPFTVLQWDGSSISVSVLLDDDPNSYDTEAFAALLPSIGHVDQAAWEAALPDRVVTPAQRQNVVGEMLADIPQPDGFTFGETGDDTLVRDRVDLAAEIQQQVACAWLNVYFQADTDSAATADALEAIATIPDWSITREIVEAWENPDQDVIGPANTGMTSLTINDDNTITYDATGEPLDGYFAAQLCDRNAVG